MSQIKVIPDLKVNNLWVKYIKQDQRCITIAGRLWFSIEARCKKGGAYQKSFPSYKNCTNDFSNFQDFAEWCQSQIGYGIAGYSLDKDILIDSNKSYNSNSCVFVPTELNSFLTFRDAARGALPIGVSLASRNKIHPYVAAMTKDGESLYLGYFSTPEEAHTAYKQAKEAEAYRWYERLKAGEFVVDERVIERMRTWKLNKQEKGNK